MMKALEFDNCLQVLYHLLYFFPHSGEDRNFTDGELKTIFLNAMPSEWQQTYTLKETRATDNFKELVAYFTTYQSIVDTNSHNKLSVPTRHILSLCGQNTNYVLHFTTTMFADRGSTVKFREHCLQHSNNNVLHSFIVV